MDPILTEMCKNKKNLQLTNDFKPTNKSNRNH